MNRILIILVVFGSTLTSRACTELDTVKIYENLAGIPFKIYEKIWFHKSKVYSYNVNKASAQDRIVMSEEPFYFLIYDKHDVLILEGEKSAGKELIGPITFYHRNGVIMRTENWSNTSTLNQGVVGSAPRPSGLWRYFDKDGILEKEEIYEITEDENRHYHRSITERTYDENGKLVSVEVKQL